MKAHKHYSDDFKAAAVQRAEKETLTIVAESLGITYQQLYGWRDAMRKKAGTGAARSPKRTYWDEEELAKLAAEWILQRCDDPFESASVLFEKSQRKVLPGERQRDLPSVKYHTGLAAEITRQWKLLLENPHTPQEIPVPPAPQIIEIEVPRKLSAAEMLETLDEPTLEALLVSMRLSRESRFHGILRGLAAHAGATGLPEVKQFVPRLEAFDAGEKRKPRIAVIGLHKGQSAQVETEVRAAALEAVVSFPDSKDFLTVSRSDYAIILRGKSGEPTYSASIGDRTIGQLGRSRVVLLDEAGALEIVQQIRGICSRK